ncbi:MAG: hypothetical protein VKJ04_01060 [Vampirovibrionales bacterium]|nr:hypothetical protein [Vampirovibrionales bacterium]
MGQDYGNPNERNDEQNKLLEEESLIQMLQSHAQLYRQYHLLGDMRQDFSDASSFRWLATNPDTLEPDSLTVSSEWVYHFVYPRREKLNPKTSLKKQRNSRPKKNAHRQPISEQNSHALQEDDLLLIKNLKNAFSQCEAEAGLIDRITGWLKAFDASLKFDSP